MGTATREYAEWSAAAELRMLSSEGVDVDQFTDADFRKYCGRGLPWRTKMVKLGRPAVERVIEDQAWFMGVADAFEGDLYSTEAETLA